MLKFKDIKRISRAGYMVDVSWAYLRSWIKENQDVTEIGCDMDPPYQRGYVWTDEQKTAYLEYIVKDGTSGKDIFWNCPGWMNSFRGPLELVDGKQRIYSVLDFLNGKIKVFGHFYNEYEDTFDWLVCRFHFHVHDLNNKIDVVQWYLDMNTGGSIHTEEDLEPARRMLEELKS